MDTSHLPFASSAGTHFRGRSCPNCGGTTVRVARRFLDRLLSVVMPVGRYRCSAAPCSWEGVLQPRRSLPALRAEPLPRRERMPAARRLEGSAAIVFKRGSPGR